MWGLGSGQLAAGPGLAGLLNELGSRIRKTEHVNNARSAAVGRTSADIHFATRNHGSNEMCGTASRKRATEQYVGQVRRVIRKKSVCAAAVRNRPNNSLRGSVCGNTRRRPGVAESLRTRGRSRRRNARLSNGERPQIVV